MFIIGNQSCSTMDRQPLRVENMSLDEAKQRLRESEDRKKGYQEEAKRQMVQIKTNTMKEIEDLTLGVNHTIAIIKSKAKIDITQIKQRGRQRMVEVEKQKNQKISFEDQTCQKLHTRIEAVKQRQRQKQIERLINRRNIKKNSYMESKKSQDLMSNAVEDIKKYSIYVQSPSFQATKNQTHDNYDSSLYSFSRNKNKNTRSLTTKKV